MTPRAAAGVAGFHVSMSALFVTFPACSRPVSDYSLGRSLHQTPFMPSLPLALSFIPCILILHASTCKPYHVNLMG